MSTSSPDSSNSLPGPALDTFGISDEGGGMQRGASYFFGFLITFVVLLLAFVGCGVLSRRRIVARRRRRFDWDMEPWTETTQGGSVGYVPPVLLEKDFIRVKSGSSWRELVPLAALVVSPLQRKSPDTSSDTPPPPPIQPANNYSPLGDHGPDIDSNLAVITRALSSASRRQSESPARGGPGLVRITSPTPYHRNPNVILAQHGAEAEEGRQRHEQGQLNRDSAPQRLWSSLLHYLNPASWFGSFVRLRRRHRQEGAAESHYRTADDEKPEEEGIDGREKVLQVAVLIEMPSSLPSSHLSHSQGKERIPDYQVGVASLPCAGT